MPFPKRLSHKEQSILALSLFLWEPTLTYSISLSKHCVPIPCSVERRAVEQPLRSRYIDWCKQCSKIRWMSRTESCGHSERYERSMRLFPRWNTRLGRNVIDS